MGKNKKIISSIFVFMLLIVGLSLPAFANGAGLDSFVIKINETTSVKVSIAEYGKAFVLKDRSPLFKYLKGENDAPVVIAFVSSDKYIAVSEYGKQFILNKKDASLAIEKSQPLPIDTVKTFKEFKGFDNDGNPILVPIIPEEPSEPTATVTITPDSLLNEGFKLANVKVNVSGIEGAAKYSITYSVYDNDNNEKTVTTKLANIGQVNEDLIQFIDEETSKIKVNLYDTNNNQINTEYKTTIK